MAAKAPFTYKLPKISAGKNRFEKVYNLHEHYTEGQSGESFADIITGNSIPKTHDSYTFRGPKGASSIKATIGLTSPYSVHNELWVWFNNEPMLPRITYSTDPQIQDPLFQEAARTSVETAKEFSGISMDFYFLTSPSDSYSTSFQLAKGENSINVMGWETAGITVQPIDFWIELEPIQNNKTSKSKKSKKSKKTTIKNSRLQGVSSQNIQPILNSADAANAFDYKEWPVTSTRLAGIVSSHLAGTELDTPNIGLTINGLASSQLQILG